MSTSPHFDDAMDPTDEHQPSTSYTADRTPPSEATPQGDAHTATGAGRDQDPADRHESTESAGETKAPATTAELAETTAEPTEPPHHVDRHASIVAQDITLNIGHGHELVVPSFSLTPGQLGVVMWHHGDERQAALLALAGRFPRRAGQLQLAGVAVPRRGRVVRSAAIAYFSNIDELDARLTVAEHLFERASLITPLWRRTPALTDLRIQDPATIMFGANDIPWNTRALDLSAIHNFALRVTTALIVQPQVLIVDDLDALRTNADAKHGWSCLQKLCDNGITVIAGTSTPASVPSTAVTVPLDKA